MEYRYQAIVLGKKEVGETDRLYILYTREAGKMVVVAKGVRKGEAKLAAQLENGNVVDISVIRTRGNGKIKGAVAEHSLMYIRKEYLVYKALLETLNQVSMLTENDHPDEEAFLLLQEFLWLTEELAKNVELEKLLFLQKAFLIKLYSILGYRLRTSKCLVSGEKLIAEKRYYFCPGEGGLIERSLASRYPGAFLLSAGGIVTLRLILTNTLSSLLKVTNVTQETKVIGRVAETFYQWTIRH